MTTRKLNAVRKHSTLGPHTFNAVLSMLTLCYPDILILPAKQIASIMALCYEQQEYGRNKCLNELSIHLK